MPVRHVQPHWLCTLPQHMSVIWVLQCRWYEAALQSWGLPLQRLAYSRGQQQQQLTKAGVGGWWQPALSAR